MSEDDEADAEDEAPPAEGEDVPDREDVEERLDEAEAALEDAETEDDLDEVEATLDAAEEDLERADLPEPDDEDEDEEGPREALEGRLSDLRDRLEEERGPYAKDVVETVADVQSTIRSTEWTEQGRRDVAAAVEAFLADAGDVLGESYEAPGVDAAPDVQADALDLPLTAIDDADLDPDADADAIAALLEAAEALSAGVDDAEEWDDLEVREKLMAQGYYDVLGHYKDFPPEWSALKEHEQQNNVDMILLALETLGSEFMEEHCLEALRRLGPREAFDPMLERAEKRDKDGIRILGKIGDEAAVDTLLEYVDADSDPQLQKVTFRALGEIGSEEATEALAAKLTMDNDNVRPYAARALGLIGDPRAIEPLATALEDSDHDATRAAAAWALRQIGTEAALEAAAEYADDRAFTVQHEAERAAEALGAATA